MAHFLASVLLYFLLLLACACSSGLPLDFEGSQTLQSGPRLSQQHVKKQVSKLSTYHWSHSSTGPESHKHYQQTLDFKVQKVNFSFINHKYLHDYMFTVQGYSFQQNCFFSPVYYSLQTMHWKHLLWIMLIVSLHGSFAVFWQVFDFKSRQCERTEPGSSGSRPSDQPSAASMNRASIYFGWMRVRWPSSKHTIKQLCGKNA